MQGFAADQAAVRCQLDTTKVLGAVLVTLVVLLGVNTARSGGSRLELKPFRAKAARMILQLPSLPMVRCQVLICGQADVHRGCGCCATNHLGREPGAFGTRHQSLACQACAGIERACTARVQSRYAS